MGGFPSSEIEAISSFRAASQQSCSVQIPHATHPVCCSSFLTRGSNGGISLKRDRGDLVVSGRLAAELLGSNPSRNAHCVLLVFPREARKERDLNPRYPVKSTRP